MTQAKENTVTVERHRYVLDWFERDKIECDLENTVYEFQYRFGPDWYLEASKYDKASESWNRVIWDRGDSFNLANPAEALAVLGDRVTKFTCISAGMKFHKALADIINRAEIIKARNLKP